MQQLVHAGPEDALREVDCGRDARELTPLSLDHEPVQALEDTPGLLGMLLRKFEDPWG